MRLSFLLAWVGCVQALERAEAKPKPPLSELFTDIYHDKPPNVLEQEQQLHDHVTKYPDRYRMVEGGGH